MSGVAGIYYRDHRPVDPADLRRMVERLSHRGPDRQDIWHDGPAGLGHCALHTTPESPFEQFPMASPCGNFVLVADARIDNRDELTSLLQMRQHNGSPVTDGEFILGAYAKWGERCPEHLLGDFAFAIWDRQEQRLFCARDHFGVKPFYYHVSGDRILFASEIKAFWAVPGAEPRINQTRIGDFLADILIEEQGTFFESVFRLPPGHSIHIDRDGTDVRSYYDLASRVDPSPTEGRDAAEALKEIFVEAVNCRLRSTGGVGAMLSGGLDSSSIASVARDALMTAGGDPIKTFSLVYDDYPECDERTYIQSILDWKGGMDPCFIMGDVPGSLEELRETIGHQDEPYFAPGGAFRLYDKARQQGLRVLLDGHGGDEVISTGFGRLRELAVAGNWLKLSSEIRSLAKAYHEPYLGTLLEYLKFGAQKRSDKLVWKVVHAGLARMNRAGRRVNAVPSVRVPWNRIVSANLADTVGLAERVQAFRRYRPDQAPTEAERHLLIMESPLRSIGFEVLDRFGSHSSVETRYPFCDRRLVEFCLGLPAREKLMDGFTRMVMRRAMEGILPEDVRWRRDKTDFTAYVRQMDYNYYRAHPSIGGRDEKLYDFVNKLAFDEILERLLDQDELPSFEAALLHKCLVLHLWLERHGEEVGELQPETYA